MAEDEVATKAPESDAASASLLPGDTVAQHGPSMGDHCVTDRPLSSDEKPTGEISKISDVEVYVTKPSDYPHAPSKLLIFLTNGVGIHSTNNQLQADKFAAEGFLTVMPDQFGGDSVPNSTKTQTDAPIEENPTFIEKVKLLTAETAKSFMIDMWLAKQTPEKVLPILNKVIEGAKEEFADAVANGGGVYAVGYCFGGKYVLLLAGEHPDTVAWAQLPKDEEQGVVKHGPVIKAGAVAHGTLVTREDIQAVRSPVSMVCIENDQLFADDIREDGRKVLQANNIPYEIDVYANVPHGFAVLGEYQDPKIRDAQTRAFDQMLNWLKSH